MKLRYEKQKGLRIKYGFRGFSTMEQGWWWSYARKRWEHVSVNDTYDGNYSSHQPCKTIRAFKRKLKYAPAGVEFVLDSRWKGHLVYGKGKNKKYFNNWTEVIV